MKNRHQKSTIFSPLAFHRLRLLKKLLGNYFRSEKLQNESSPIFSNFRPEFCPRILLRIFPEFFEELSCFVSWETETRKNSPKIPAFFQMQNSQANTKKIFTKCFWRAGTVKLFSQKKRSIRNVILRSLGWLLVLSEPLL